jgi:hypothetical protein
MQKKVAKHLSDLADTLPLVFELEYEEAIYTGEEMNLSGYGETKHYEKGKYYKVTDLPVFRAVEHRQQLKDAWKKGGLEEVKGYYERIKGINEEIE